jgi:hypothetical protein
MFARLKYTLTPSKHPASADNNDSRQRNRLSKPPNSSSLNLSGLSLLQPGNRNSTLFPLSTSTDDLEQHSPLSPNDEPRELLKARISGPDSEDQHPASHPDRESWKGVAFVVTDLERNHSISPTPKSPVASPLSGIFNTSRLSLIPSREHKDGKEMTPPEADNRSGSASREDLTAPIPIRRSSLCRPGIATRMKRDERLGSSPSGEVGVDAECDHHLDSVFPEEALGGDLEALNLETTIARRPVPPPLVRTETPDDLVFLGGLKLGSLHVTNGRVSPAPSDLSRRVKARSTPNLRAASSDYGDSDQEEIDMDARCTTRDGCSKKSILPEMPSRFISQTPRFKSPLRFSSNDIVPKIDTKHEGAITTFRVHTPSEDVAVENNVAERSTSIAEDCMTELPASPVEVVRRTSTSGSLLNSTTKCTEFDDDLFEDDSVSPSDSDSVDNSTLDTLYSANDVTAVQNKQASSPRKSRPNYNLADSGYSSNMSLRAAQEKVNEKSAQETKLMTAPGIDMNTLQNELTIPKKSQDHRPGPRPLRPSILKQTGGTATSLPIFQNILHSSTTISTVITTASMPPTHKAKKLTKLRSLSRNTSQDITVQGNHEIPTGSIPPVPAEFAANLAIRSEQVPELEHTYETRQHTAESPTTSHVDPVNIRFPSPAKSIDELDRESSSPPRPPNYREFTFLRRNKSDKRSSIRKSSNEISEVDALAIVQNFGTVGHSLGDNPYDIARTNPQPIPSWNLDPAQRINPHNISSTSPTPKFWSGMDAETAAELARRRSRTIYERDLPHLTEKRNIFNDRGGLPGKNLRPMSFAASTPPLPPLPSGFESNHKRGWSMQTTSPQLQQRNSWTPQYDQTTKNENTSFAYIREAPVSNGSHDNRQYWEEHSSDYHQPQNDRPQSWRSDVVEIEFDQRQNWNSNTDRSETDQRGGWANSDGYSNSHSQPESISHYENDDRWMRGQAAPHIPHHWNQHETWEDAPPPPPTHSPRPVSIAAVEEETDTWPDQAEVWRARRQSAGETLGYANNPHPYEDSLYPEIPPRSAPSHQARTNTHAEPFTTHHSYHENDLFPPQSSYDVYNSRRNSLNPPQPQSQPNSYNGSYAGSLAESLHPPHDPPRVSPSPQFGRYSGGFNYGYEHGSGFGGSAGTRSVSGVAGASRKGKELSEGFGVDLSDVPIIAGLKKL